jgi:hypothetical protein
MHIRSGGEAYRRLCAWALDGRVKPGHGVVKGVPWPNESKGGRH